MPARAAVSRLRSNERVSRRPGWERQMYKLGFTFLLTLNGTWSSSADVITLSDGSRIIGTVERLTDGKLILATQFAGTLEIDKSLITTIDTDGRHVVGLTTGDRLVGEIDWKPELDRAVVMTEMGGIPISIDKVEAIWPVGAKSPEVIALQLQTAKIQAEIEAKAARWTATLEAGLNFQEGNTDRLEARGRAELRRTAEKDQLRFYLSGEYTEQNDRRSAAEVKAGLGYEHALTERVFAYLNSEIEYDEFENLDFRFTTTAGGGYYWIKKPGHELKTRLGLGFQHETYRDGMSSNDAVMDLGLDYRIDITPWLQYTHAATYLPTFSSVRDYRLIFDNALVVPFGESDRWKMKFGALYEYKALPQPGFDRLDQTYYANVLLEVK